MEEKQEKSRIDRQFDFIREIDKEKFIQRQTRLSDNVHKTDFFIRCKAA